MGAQQCVVVRSIAALALIVRIVSQRWEDPAWFHRKREPGGRQNDGRSGEEAAIRLRGKADFLYLANFGSEIRFRDTGGWRGHASEGRAATAVFARASEVAYKGSNVSAQLSKEASGGVAM